MPPLLRHIDQNRAKLTGQWLSKYGLDTYVMDKDNITVVSKDGTTEGAYSRCGY